jgi:hypothetical protein
MKVYSLIKNGKRKDYTEEQLQKMIAEKDEVKVEKKDIDKEQAR